MKCNFKNDDGSINICRVISITAVTILVVTSIMMTVYLQSAKKDISDLRGAVVPLIERANEARRQEEEQYRRYMQKQQLKKQLEAEKKQQLKP